MPLAMAASCLIESVSAHEADTLRSHTLRGVQVKGHRTRQLLASDGAGASVVDMRLMELMPRILGNADPIHYAQLLPGVQTNSEYDAGLHIQGCDNAHNAVGINGVPLYNVAHMMGFFSTFNATHFSRFRLAKSPTEASASNRLGGAVDMQTADTLTRTVGGDLSVGPLSSQATLRLPLGRKASLTVSAREAYFNLLYSPWLKIDGQQIGYAFGDYNVSLLVCPSSRDHLQLDGYLGHDNVSFAEDAYQSDSHLRWGNAMAALHHTHRFTTATFRQTAYFTTYRNRLTIAQTNIDAGLKSSVSTLGYKASLATKALTVGTDIAYHRLTPQEPHVAGVINGANDGGERQQALEASVFGDYRLPLTTRLTGQLGLRGTLYRQGSNAFYGLDPSLSLTYSPAPQTRLSLRLGSRRQYLMRTGFSDIGLPTEFWFASGSTFKPQRSLHASLEFETYLHDKTYRLSVEGYFKRLYHQVEYVGTVFDMLYATYSLDRTLITGRGHNYGLNLLFEKRRGRLTGWLSYSAGRAMRQYPGTEYAGTYPASHERIHELNAVATLKVGKRWSLGATGVFATGTPYTKVERYYLLSHHLMADYGPHNGSRVGNYLRVDLSASYDFRTRNGRRSGINLSLYNVTMRDNPLFYRLRIHQETVAYKPFTFAVRLLPSINYYYSF